MSFATLNNDLEEFRNLQLYHTKIKTMLDLILKNQTSCLLRVGIKDHDKPAIPLEVEYQGETLDWSGFPEGLKKFPFLIIPGASVKTPPMFDEQFDLDMTPELIVSFLIYLLKHIDKRMKHLSNKFATYDKKT